MNNPDAENKQPESYTNLREAIEANQNKWKLLKKFPFKTFSQGIEIPAYLESTILNFVVDNLPEYIPIEIKKKLLNRPTPVIEFGILVDERMYTDIENGYRYLIPDEIEDDQLNNWRKGLLLLDELAVDTLMIEMLLNAYKSKTNSPLTVFFRPLIILLKRQISGTQFAYNRIIETTKKIIGEENYELFRRYLIITMLSGDETEINIFLRDFGFEDLNKFAIEIGGLKGAAYNQLPEVVKKNEFLERFYDSLDSSGMISTKLIGVINIPLVLKLPTSTGFAVITAEIINATFPYLDKLTFDSVILLLCISLFTTFRAIAPNLQILASIVHETIHYLSMDIDHFGLRRGTPRKR